MNKRIAEQKVARAQDSIRIWSIGTLTEVAKSKLEDARAELIAYSTILAAIISKEG